MIDNEKLIQLAKEALTFSYSPYSNFPVGAALLTEDGEVVQGCNVENASYGLTNCAERTAFFKAVSQGKRKFKTLAIVADTDKATAPCGACRQVISEFCDQNMPVVLSNLNGDVKIMTVKDLLPFAFTPMDLE